MSILYFQPIVVPRGLQPGCLSIPWTFSLSKTIHFLVESLLPLFCVWSRHSISIVFGFNIFRRVSEMFGFSIEKSERLRGLNPSSWRRWFMIRAPFIVQLLSSARINVVINRDLFTDLQVLGMNLSYSSEFLTACTRDACANRSICFQCDRCVEYLWQHTSECESKYQWQWLESNVQLVSWLCDNRRFMEEILRVQQK